jgi:glycosyltransferase involved in cell wall biosynthesis
LYGAEQVILNLARTAHTTSYVGALSDGSSAMLEVVREANKNGLNTVVFDSRGRFDPKPVLAIRRFLRNNRIDILHSHGYKSDLVALFAALSNETQWIATNHVWHPISWVLRLYESIDAWALRFARRVIAVSGGVKDDLLAAKVPSKNIRIISNGIDIDRFTNRRSTESLKASFNIDDSDVVVAIVGRLSPEKGHKVFLAAAATIAAKAARTVKFLIVGDGPMREELEAEVIRLNLRERVVFAGFRQEMPEIYALIDVLVNASTIEGLPMTLLEAMAAGVAVIAARTGGIPELITDRQTGLLFDAGDVDALVTHLTWLINDDETRQKFAAAGSRFVKTHHSRERMCEDYEQLYSEIAAAR